MSIEHILDNISHHSEQAGLFTIKLLAGEHARLRGVRSGALLDMNCRCHNFTCPICWLKRLARLLDSVENNPAQHWVFAISDTMSLEEKVPYRLTESLKKVKGAMYVGLMPVYDRSVALRIFSLHTAERELPLPEKKMVGDIRIDYEQWQDYEALCVRVAEHALPLMLCLDDVPADNDKVRAIELAHLQKVGCTSKFKPLK